MSGLDPRYRVGSFVIVNLDLVDALGSWEAAGVLQRIEWRCQATGSWTASLEDVATEVRLSEHRTRSALKALVERGYLARERSAPYDPTPVWTVILTNDEPAPEGPEPTRDRESKKSMNVPAESGVTCDRNPPSPPTDKGNNYPPTPTDGGEEALWADDTPRADREDPLRGFDAWYAVYPKKVGKGRAKTNWTKALKSGADPDVMLAALRRQLQHLSDQKARGYCPDPGSWLGAERWEDETPVVALRPYVPSPGETYDPEFERTLPPPRTDPFAARG